MTIAAAMGAPTSVIRANTFTILLLAVR